MTSQNSPVARKSPSNYSQEEGRALDLASWTLSGIKTNCPVERASIKSAIYALKAITSRTAEMRRCASNTALAHAWESKEVAKAKEIKPNFTTDSIVLALRGLSL